MKVAIYVRVSTDKQEVENQLIQLKDYVKANDWEIYDEYCDVISGKKDSRPEYDRLFKDAHKRLFETVLFWDLSRFSRSGTLFTLQKLKELDNIGAHWVSYQEQYINSMGPFRDVVISIFATLNKIEADRISQKTKAGLNRAKADGKRLGRRAKQINFDKVWDEYKQQGSINKASKVLPYGYGTVHYIISNNVRDQETYEKLIEKRV